MVASEASPFSKTGGLADVIGALPAALVERGEDVAVVVPRHATTEFDTASEAWRHMIAWLGPKPYDTTIYHTYHRDVLFFFVEAPALFDRPNLYGYPDDHIRYAAFSQAALGVARNLFRPQILHLHDWQASPASAYLRHYFSLDPTFLSMKILLTVHNLGYQGVASRDALTQIGLADLYRPDALEYYGDINLLKGGLIYSDWLSTVSRRYAQEIQTPEYGCGLEGVLRSRSNSLTGIVNGADYTEWNPETDGYIAARYSAENLSGKWECKRDLLRTLGLPEQMDRPVIGIVSRFVYQKGFDLLAEAAPLLVEQNVTLVALGTGEKQYEDFFREVAASFPEKVAVRIAYDNELAHKIEAGADMFLMPSRYEPCGLSQIYSLRYGTVPIVRATGGLDDTIEEGTGFKFQEYSSSALMSAIQAALSAYADRPRWDAIVKRGMEKDFSWKTSAAEYSRLYAQLVG